LTARTHESEHTITCVPVGKIGASCTICTWITLTLVDIYFATHPGESTWTLALEAIDLINAYPAIHARVGHTFINIDLAADAIKASGAHANEAIVSIDAAALVATGVAEAFIFIYLALVTRETSCTGTRVAIDKVITSATFLAR
jgi:hypothetical protein